jgi:hypothetical protein
MIERLGCTVVLQITLIVLQIRQLVALELGQLGLRRFLKKQQQLKEAPVGLYFWVDRWV